MGAVSISAATPGSWALNPMATGDAPYAEAFLTTINNPQPQALAEEPISLLFTWGDGHSGALGHGGVRSEVSPRLCTLLVPFKLHTVACGEAYTLVALASGELCSCGSGTSGVLGHGDEQDRPAFEVVQALQGTKVVSLAAGERHCAALSESGSLFSWGDGSDAQVGRAGKRLTPQRVLGLGADVHKELASALDGGGGGSNGGGEDGENSENGENGEKGEGGADQVGGHRISSASQTALSNAVRCASVSCGGSHTLATLRSGAACSCAWPLYVHPSTRFLCMSSVKFPSVNFTCQAEKVEEKELGLWERQLPAHLRLGAEFGLRREEQSSLLQRHAKGAAASAVTVAATRSADWTQHGGLRKSTSVPALLTAMRHRRPPLLTPLVRAPRY